MVALTPISIWDIPEQGTRGPKGRHDRAAVAAAAIRLADAGGLDGVTMRGVAAELGIAPMSLYNYVPTKDHLIQLMTDMTGGEYRFPDPEPVDKRAAIADLARQGRDDHPAPSLAPGRDTAARGHRPERAPLL